MVGQAYCVQCLQNRQRVSECAGINSIVSSSSSIYLRGHVMHSDKRGCVLIACCDETRAFSHLVYHNRTTSDTFISGPYNYILLSLVGRSQVHPTRRHENVSYVVRMHCAILHTCCEKLRLLRGCYYASRKVLIDESEYSRIL
jgi:hypothetical protein